MIVLMYWRHSAHEGMHELYALYNTLYNTKNCLNIKKRRIKTQNAYTWRVIVGLTCTRCPGATNILYCVALSLVRFPDPAYLGWVGEPDYSEPNCGGLYALHNLDKIPVRSPFIPNLESSRHANFWKIQKLVMNSETLKLCFRLFQCFQSLSWSWLLLQGSRFKLGISKNIPSHHY